MRLRQHGPDRAQEDIRRDDAETKQPLKETADAEDPPQCTDEKPLTLEAICTEALMIAETMAVRPRAVTPAHTSNDRNESGTSHECTKCHRRFRQHDQLRRHVHNHRAEGSSPPPCSDVAEALLKRRMEKRFHRPRAIRPRRLPGLQFERLMPDDEETIRREEADEERYFFSRHVGVRFHNGPQDEESKLSVPSLPVSTADLRNFGRAEELKNRPSHYHRNWISKKDLCDRKQMGRGMYKGYSVHVHDQVYFADEVGNKIWLVDDEGQAVLFQDQKL